MSRLKPEKLSVEYRDGVSETEPIIPRRYTLTHSDLTADLFLTIAPEFAYDKVSDMRDEVLGEWLLIDGSVQYYVYLQIDGQLGKGMSGIRNEVFRRELPLALEAIRYGDRLFFDAHPELNQSPILVYFLSSYPEYNTVENWGSFEDYEIKEFRDNVMVNSLMEYHILIDEKIGDVTGDGIPDRISLFGDKSIDSPYFSNLRVEIDDGRTGVKMDMITEISGYNPTLFLGDFTKDQIMDIKISMDTGGSGGYGIFAIYSCINNEIVTIFTSDRYNTEFQYKVEYSNFYKINIGNVMLNKLYFLDITDKGYDYLSMCYNEIGKLIKPMKGEVLALGALIPVIGNEQENSFDLLAIQRIIGSTNSDTLGYIENLLSWNGERFVSIRMMASTTGTKFISQIHVN